jgi:hypothetical protein
MIDCTSVILLTHVLTVVTNKDQGFDVCKWNLRGSRAPRAGVPRK